MNIWHTIKRS